MEKNHTSNCELSIWIELEVQQNYISAKKGEYFLELSFLLNLKFIQQRLYHYSVDYTKIQMINFYGLRNFRTSSILVEAYI